MEETTNVKAKKKIKTKDLVFVGVFVALYVAVMMVAVTILGFVPVLYLMAPFFVGIVCAPVYLVMAMRLKKPGPVLILSIIMGLMFIGTAPVGAVWVVATGILAEIVIALGKYTSKKHYLISWVVFSLSTFGPYTSILVAKQNYLDITLSYFGQEYADALGALLSNEVVALVLLGAAVGGVIGALLSNKILKKHFLNADLV